MTSMLFTDPSELRAIARRISDHAGRVRTQATTLSAAVQTAHWYSPAANQFRDRAGAISATMIRAAGELDDAADAMMRHADRVSGLLDLLRAEAGAVASGVEHGAHAVLSGAVHAGGSVLHAVGL
jgi:hypothetical protein